MINKIKYGRSYFEEYLREEEDKISLQATMQEKIFQDLSVAINMVDAYDGNPNFYVDSNNKIQCDARPKRLFENTVAPPAQVTIRCINIAMGRPALPGEAYKTELIVYPSEAIGYTEALYVIGIKETLRYIYSDFICQLEKHPLYYLVNHKEYAYDIAVKLGLIPLVSPQYHYAK